VYAVLPALLVLVLSWGLAKGRRSAWWMTVLTHALLLGFGVTLAVTSITGRADTFALLAHNELSGLSGLVLPIVMPIAVLAVLIAGRSRFQVLPPRADHRRMLATVGAAVAAAFLLYTGLGAMIGGHFTPAQTWPRLAGNFPLRLIPPGYLGFGLPRVIPHGWPATILVEWTGVAVWVVALVAVVLSFRENRSVGIDGDAERALTILTGTGGTALSYLTTWQDNQYWFNGSGTTYIAYRPHGGIAVTATDPVGPLPERAAAIVEFSRFCDENSLIPCLYSVTEKTRDFANGLGWQDLQVAEETVLDLGSLAFRGRKFQDVRTAINRAARAGINAEWISYRTASLAVTEQVRAISEEWVADKALPEMGFTLGGLDELNDPRVRCLIAVGQDGHLHGITSWLPVYRGGVVIGWTLDFMRRPATGFPGVMEFLIGTAAMTFQDEGAEFVSLSGAPLARSPGEDGQASAMQRLLDQLGRTLEPVYGFTSLLAFKSKFQPSYRPLYMCYPDPVALPRIAAAIGHAYLPHLSLAQLMRTTAKL
jgi:phosphatidylglycerol lysyltransferase